ncbi:MAG: hypothetical protein QOD62_2033, partial [Actinomycetota bacterium]|nr:hypothetical protein [Actinomycetota bacterium]
MAGPASDRDRLSHDHNSARSTNPARKGLRSMERSTTRRWSSSWTGNALTRPCQTVAVDPESAKA